MSSNLSAFFDPRSVAVVGASARESSVGYAVLANLLGRRAADGFEGPIYPVNPKGGEILGCRAYESLSAIDRPVDLVVVAIPPRFIPALMDEAGRAGARAVIVISAGFSEMGGEGRALEREMIERAHAANLRVIGPNCLGVIRPSSGLNASFAASSPPPGRIGVLSQSGALITGVISYAERERFGLSTAVSLGGKADVNDVDVLAWMDSDEQTRAIALYVEAFPDPLAFFELVHRIETPIVALKGGATAAGAAAASSHTGSLAGSAAAYRAAFAQAGVLQATSIGDFLAWSRALAYQPPAGGNRLAIVTNAGGPGVLCADEASRLGIELAQLSPETLAALDEVLPAVWSHNNPIDIIGDATPERYRDAINIIGAAPEVDGIVTIMTVQAMTDPMATAEAIAAAYDDPSWSKPIMCSFLGLIGTEVGWFLDAHGVPEFNLPERAVSAMGALMRRGAWLQRGEAPQRSFSMPAADLSRARALAHQARDDGQTNLDLSRARDVLAAAGIRYNGSATATSENEAVSLAEDIGFPVVIKVVSPDVVHKSDIGGVVLDVIDAAGVREACSGIRARVDAAQPGAQITGFTIEEQVSGTEIIVGMSRDGGFGSLLMVGMGGVFVEVYKDVAFRLLPRFSRRDALDMIDEIRAQALLDGARNRPVLDRDELAEVLIRTARLVEACPEIVELDINPLVITRDRGLVAIDGRVIVADDSQTPGGVLPG